MARSRASLSIQYIQIIHSYSLLMLPQWCLYCTHVISRQRLTQSFSLWASWAEHPCWRRQQLPHCCWSAGCWQSCRLMRLPRSALPGRLWLGNHMVRFCMTCTWRVETRCWCWLMISLWIFPSWAGWWWIAIHILIFRNVPKSTSDKLYFFNQIPRYR